MCIDEMHGLGGNMLFNVRTSEGGNQMVIGGMTVFVLGEGMFFCGGMKQIGGGV